MTRENIYNKVTLVTSPIDQSGKTTIANNLAYIYSKKGYVTGVIELNRYIGSSPYINDNVKEEKNKSLKRAMEEYNEQQILSNFLQSKHNEGLFTLSLRIDDKIADLFKFNPKQIEKILKIARKRFDKVFIEAPMNYLDNGFMGALNIHPDQVIQILDNNIVSLHKLKLYDMYLKKININFNKVITVINKDEELLSEVTLSTLKNEFELLKYKDIIKIPYLKGLIKASNEGEILADMTPSNKKEKQFIKGLNEIVNKIESSKKKKRSIFKFLKSKKKYGEMSG